MLVGWGQAVVAVPVADEWIWGDGADHLPAQLMSQNEPYAEAVIDIFPWTSGLGFSGAEVWWRYVQTRSGADRLDLLIMLALLNDEICGRLLQHDPGLLEHFNFSEATRMQLKDISAVRLEDFVTRLGQYRSDAVLRRHR